MEIAKRFAKQLGRPTWPHVMFWGLLAAILAGGLLIGGVMRAQGSENLTWTTVFGFVMTLGFLEVGLNQLRDRWLKDHRDGLVMPTLKVYEAFKLKHEWLMLEVGFAGMTLPYLCLDATGMAYLMWLIPIRAFFVVALRYTEFRATLHKAP